MNTSETCVQFDEFINRKSKFSNQWGKKKLPKKFDFKDFNFNSKQQSSYFKCDEIIFIFNSSLERS